MPLKWICFYFLLALETDSPVWDALLWTLIPWSEFCYEKLRQNLHKMYAIDFQAETAMRFLEPVTNMCIFLNDNSDFPVPNSPTYRGEFGNLELALDFQTNKHSVRKGFYLTRHVEPTNAIDHFIEEIQNNPVECNEI